MRSAISKMTGFSIWPTCVFAAGRGITVESQVALVLTLCDGKIIRSADYISHKEGLGVVGLAE
jgi:hypothetical protein